MATKRTSARKTANKRTSVKRVATRTIKGRSTSTGRQRLRAQQNPRAAKKGKRVAVKSYRNPKSVNWEYKGSGRWEGAVRDSRGVWQRVEIEMPKVAP